MSITTITLLLLSMIPALVIVMCHRFENLLARAECGSMGRPRYLWRNTLVVFLVVTQAAMPLHYGGVFTSLKAWLGESERSFSLSGNIIRAGAAENNLSAWEMLSKDSAEIVNSTSQLYAPSNDLNQNSSTEVYFTMPANWNFKFDDFSDNWYEGGHNWYAKSKFTQDVPTLENAAFVGYVGSYYRKPPEPYGGETYDFNAGSPTLKVGPIIQDENTLQNNYSYDVPGADFGATEDSQRCVIWGETADSATQTCGELGYSPASRVAPTSNFKDRPPGEIDRFHIDFRQKCFGPQGDWQICRDFVLDQQGTARGEFHVDELIYYGTPPMDEDALAGDRGCDPCIDSNTAKQATRDVGEPINTATGDYSYSPEPDIQISGHGHNLSFRRIYSTASNWRYLDAVPMGDHWSHNFNMQLVFDSNPAAALVGESGKFITGNNAAHRFRPVDEVDANGDPTGKRVYEFADTFLAELHVCQNVGDSTSYSTDGCTEDVMTYDSYNENYGYYEVVLHDNTRYILERRSGATSGSTTQSATQSEETEIVITPVPPADPGPTNIAQIIRKYEPGNTVPLVFTYSSFAEVRARTGTDGGIDGYARDYLKSIEIGESGRGIQFNYLHGTGAENPPIEIATYNDIGDHPVDETAGTDLYFSVLLESVSYLGSASPNVDYNYGHAELQPLASSSYTKQDGSPVDFISHYTTNPTKGYRLISVNDIRGETWEYGYEAFNRDSNGFIDLTITGLTFMTQVTNPEDQIIERQTYYTKADINADNAAALDVNYDDLHRVKEQYRGPVSGGELIVRLNYSNNGLGSAFTGANNVFRLANNGGISFETRVEDGNGNTRIYNYDTAGTLDSVELVQPDGTEETVSAADYSLTNAYRPAQLTSSGILNPLEMIWSEDGERLLQQTDEENNVTSFDYSPPHSQDYNVPHQIIGPRDRDQDGDDMTNDPLQVTTIHYETNPYLATLPTSITNALGLNTNLNYQPDGKLDTVTGPDGIVTHHGYSADGDLTNITVGGGIETRYDYDAMGRVERTCRVGNNGNEICQYVDYDAAGNVTQTIEDETGEAIITNIEYDGAARPHVITDVLGRKTYMFYDEASRLVRTIENCTASECSRTTPRSATTSDTNIITDHVYDPVGNLITVIDTLGRTDHTCYDVWSRPVRTVQNATVDYDEACGDISPSPTNASNPDDNIVTEFIYDDRSNLATVVYPMAEGERRRDHTCYDNLNRPIKTIENASSEYQSQSDACDNASRGQSENVITEIAYDEAGNVTQVTLPDNTVNQFRYDALDRQYATILNHVDTVTDPTTENLTTITLFDESGNVKSLIEPDGDITYHCYDSVRRLKNTVVNVSASSTDLGIPSSVDAKNTVIDIEGVACQDNYTPAADADKDVILTYTYDQYERVKTVTSPLDDDSSVTTTYDYDGLSRVVREHKTYTNAGVDTLGRTTFHDYDDGGRVTRITEAEGTTEARTHRFFYDEMDRRTSTVMNYQDGVYDPTTPDMDVVTSAQYTAVGFMKTQTGPNGNPTINHEDGLYRVHQIEDAYGHRSTFEYDAVGNLQKTIDRNGNATTYNYDGMYRQEETISPQTDNTGENYSTFIQYDAMGHPHIVTDAEQVQTRLDYDALGRVVEVRENYVQNMNNNVLDSTTGEYINVQTEYTYDVDGNLNQVELPSFGGGERKFDFTYDAMNRRTGFDAPGFEDDWTTQYDQGGRPIFVTTPQDADPQDPDAYTAQMYYDDQGRLQTLDYQDGDNLDVSYTYDLFDRRQTMSDHTGTTQYRYDRMDRLKCVDTPSSSGTHNITTYGYDAAGLRQAMGMSGHLTDDCDTVSESDLRQVEYDYDDLNRLRYVRDWEAGTTYTQDGTSYDVGYSYDDGGRLTGMALPNGTSATMQYDADDFLDRIDYFDSQQQRLTFYDYEVNGVGLRTQMREPDMATCDALPGDANQLVSAITAANASNERSTICLSKDTLYDFQSPAESGGQNALPEITTDVAILGSGATLQHDEVTATEDFRFFEVTDTGSLSLYDLTLTGGMAVNGGAIHNSGTLALSEATLTGNQATGNGGAIYSLNADVSGTDVTLENNSAAEGGGAYIEGGAFHLVDGTITSNTATVGGGGAFRDVLGQVDRVAVEDNISTSDGGGFNIEEGNPASMGTTLPSLPVSADFDLDTGLSRTINYQYDNLYRLTDANYFVGGFSTSNYDYTYDIWGNRTQETVTAGADTQTTDYLYNISNQLVGVQTNTMAGASEAQLLNYDPDGNLIEMGVADGVSDFTLSGLPDFDVANIVRDQETFDWDAADRLTSTRYDADADDTDEAVHTYTYNGDGDRVQQVISDGTSTETIDYLLDANSGLTQVLGELSDNDDMYYLLGLDVIGGENSDGWSYHHTDGLGSLRAVTDTAESLVSSASYSPYGVPVQNDIVDTSFGFTGEQIDNNGLQYLRARYYSPELGTFLSRDPVFGQVGVAMSMNGYSYAHSNPTNFTDPSGQFVCGGLCIVGAGIAIGATVGALAGGGIDLAAQLATGTDWKCVDWNSVGKSALQGAVLGAVSGGVGAALGIAGAGAVATFGITEGVDFVAGVAMDTLVNDMTLRQAVATNALGFGVGGALGLVGRGIGKAIMRSGVVDAVANGRTGRAIANSGMGRMLRQSADTPSSQRRAASGAACHSFSEDTLVSTTEGDIEIDEVEVGDTVYAYDERTGEVEEHTVVNTFVHDDDQIVTLTIDGEVVETTPWHPFYTDVGWEDAGDLQPGDRILSLDGDYGVVDSVVIADETQTMYDLDVETVDTFAVGDGAWVVHNLDVCPPLPSPQLDANGLPQSGLWRIRRYTQRIENNLRTMRHSAGKFEFYAEWPITTPRNKAAFESVYESFGLPKQKLSGAVEFNIDIGKWNVIWDPAFRYDDSVNNAIVVSLFPRHFNGEMDIIGSADITQAYADELFNGFNLALPGVNPLFYDVNGNIIQLNDAGNIIRLGGE